VAARRVDAQPIRGQHEPLFAEASCRIEVRRDRRDDRLRPEGRRERRRDGIDQRHTLILHAVCERDRQR
jgi:hypothetical protein